MLELRALTPAAIVLRILLAVLAGGIIGLDRGLKQRAAGLRTYTLVCVGACMVMMTNQYVYQSYGNGDPVRMGAQVISGIGFLGAGTIIVTPRQRIRGLTTAAGLWASACIGLAIGIGLHEVAIVGSAAVLTALTLFRRWDDLIQRRSPNLEIYIELEPTCQMGDFFRSARRLELELSGLRKEQEGLAFIVTVRGRQRMVREELLGAVAALEGVQYWEVL